MTENFDGLYRIREAVLTDHNFIYNSFLKDLYYGNTWFNKIPKNIFMDHYKKIVEFLILSPKSAVNIACLPDDPNTILGYSILSADFTKVHFVYVKSKWRRHGIAKKLLPRHPEYVTHLTTLGEELLNKFENNVLFNPFI